MDQKLSSAQCHTRLLQDARPRTLAIHLAKIACLQRLQSASNQGMQVLALPFDKHL